ncbi:MAG: aldose 1-epimerase family protein [Clostridia bacterium]|nr:aldose 1-epimerase family protein [Clostridia bacterium]
MRYSIKNDHLTVEVDSFGAELASVRDDKGLEYLWQGDPNAWTGRAPILFPYVGKLRNGSAESAEGTVSGGGHGFARRTEWALKAQSDTAVTLGITDTEATRAAYPYAFALDITYALEGDTLHQIYTVHNPGKVPLPYCLGGHPGFNVPLTDGEQFEDYTITFDQPETADCPQVDMAAGLILHTRNRFLTDRDWFSLNHVLFRGDALIFDQLRSHRVRLASTVSGRGVEMDFAGWELFGIWTTPGDAPFVCLEPWTGSATWDIEDDVFEHKRGMASLAAGDTAEKSFSMRFF